MKNFVFLLALSAALFLSSCSKEEVVTELMLDYPTITTPTVGVPTGTFDYQEGLYLSQYKLNLNGLEARIWVLDELNAGIQNQTALFYPNGGSVGIGPGLPTPPTLFKATRISGEEINGVEGPVIFSGLKITWR